jgi:putative ribosome biogenesis GTPase RsgA
MIKNLHTIEKLGFEKWFQDHVDPRRLAELEIARVIAVHKDRYTITSGEGYVPAELVGKLLFSASFPVDYPAVGDWVLVKFYDENTFAVIHEIIQRKSLLKPGLTCCLLGSSGVGKTTLLNHLIGESVFRTKAVRKKDSKGRHATTSRQLITLDGGAMVVDTPGMRELENFSVETGLDETFAEITALTGKCRFSDCSHTREKGCAVLTAVQDGILSEKRYRNYMKMVRESIFNDMSYVEKRQKDKQFARHCKTVMTYRKKQKPFSGEK